jgi:hypothetical protein
MSTKHDETNRQVLSYARPRGSPDASSRQPVEAAAEDFLFGAWGASILLGPLMLLINNEYSMLLVGIIGCGMLVSVVGAGIIAFGVSMRRLLKRQPLVARSIWATHAAGVAWPLGLIAICSIGRAAWYENRLLIWLLAWALLEPLAASLLLFRRAP